VAAAPRRARSQPSPLGTAAFAPASAHVGDGRRAGFGHAAGHQAVAAVLQPLRIAVDHQRPPGAPLTGFTPFAPGVRSIAISPEQGSVMKPSPSFPLSRRGVLATGVLAALLNLAAVPAALASGDLVRVEVLDRDSGDVLRVWHDHGRPVVAGRPGARYALRLVNTSGERVLAVVAIDGVNVVTGETASVGQRGYVLDPSQRTEITGWRKSNDEVAAFEFTPLSDSYAARTGRPLDVGVIGVATFREAPRMEISETAPDTVQRPEPRAGFAGAARTMAPPAADAAKAAAPGVPAPAQEARRQADTAAESRASGRLQALPSERLGTGHGARETSVVRLTSFERASSTPDQRVEIRYDSMENLVAAGIIPPPRMAHPFPADPGYVPDPPRR
jgi:hypothetical protein